MFSLRKVAATVAVAALALAGCSAADQKKADSGKGSTVTILTHDSFNLSKEDIAAFEKESGYKLKTVSTGDGTVLNQLKLNKDKPTVDGFFGIDSFNAQAVVDAGLAADFVPKDFSSPYIVDYKLTPIDRGHVCLNVDNEWFKARNQAAPASFDDLLKPEFKKLTVLTDPLTSTPGFAFLTATITKYGDDWKTYWTNLLANGAKIDDGWSSAYYTDFSGGDGKGAYPIVLSYSSSPAYSQGKTGSVDATCIEQVEYAGVTEGAKNPDGAQTFISFLVSEKVQKTIPENMYMYPVLDSVKLPEDWQKYAQMPKNPIEVDLKKVAKNRESWLKEWSELYQKSNPAK
ncbi:thiamine transport system substrate-binding protein [Arcanobacterium pluranimalium]|uniref:thiamine ABC transporter substrate-binding protein n=1 Tax=Arcanobacterium pluranimalium TaxID=108028 RepID=UPI0019585E5B|nr:thiamine ABC transporter substrate-binding protein [Arcanobacterium pluranimalium]MBM7824283.1 thiamine transport system substrate-binding protein [Arcanobacterium pluranimalium]